jgi:hypothetical protein
MYLEWIDMGLKLSQIYTNEVTQMTAVPGSVFVGSCQPKKQIMIGVVGNEPHTAILSLSQALKLASHIRSTVRRISRQGGFDDESDI